MAGRWYKVIENEGVENFTENKWYKYIGSSDKFVTKSKWYKFLKEDQYYFEVLDNENQEKNPMSFVKRNIEKYFDLSNPMDYNPDEVKVVKKEETKPQLKVDTITIVILQDCSYQTTSTLEYPEMIKHIKQVSYIGDKQINEGN
jgi:hypothetical protein